MKHEFVPAPQVFQVFNKDDACTILDVREIAEFQTEHILGSKHTPLSKLDQHFDQLDKEHTYYVLCQSGNRACKAGEKLQDLGFKNIKIIEGGMSAWKQENLPVNKGQSKVWSLERQVRFTAGLLMLVGLGIGFYMHPAGYVLSAFIGAGLIFAAITNTCGMAMVLAKMPWNQ